MPSRPWLPSDAITTLAVWLDPSDSNSISLDGNGRILQVKDKSGNGNHFAPPSNASGLRLTQYNSRNAFLGENGSDTVARLVSTTAGLNNLLASDCTLATVSGATAYGGSSVEQTTFGAGTADGSKRAYAGAYSADTSGNNSYSVFARFNTATSGVGLTADAIMIMLHAGSNVTAAVNGNLAASTASATSFTVTPGAFYVGRPVPASANSVLVARFVGDSIGYFGSLSTSDRQKLEGYLAAKWGLQYRLPSSHPYASSAPVIAYNSYAQAIAIAISAGVSLGLAAGKSVASMVSTVLSWRQSLSLNKTFRAASSVTVGRVYSNILRFSATLRVGFTRASFARVVPVLANTVISGVPRPIRKGLTLTMSALSTVTGLPRFFAYGLPPEERVVRPFRRVRFLKARRDA